MRPGIKGVRFVFVACLKACCNGDIVVDAASETSLSFCIEAVRGRLVSDAEGVEGFRGDGGYMEKNNVICNCMIRYPHTSSGQPFPTIPLTKRA